MAATGIYGSSVARSLLETAVPRGLASVISCNISPSPVRSQFLLSVGNVVRIIDNLSELGACLNLLRYPFDSKHACSNARIDNLLEFMNLISLSFTVSSMCMNNLELL